MGKISHTTLDDVVKYSYRTVVVGLIIMMTSK